MPPASWTALPKFSILVMNWATEIPEVSFWSLWPNYTIVSAVLRGRIWHESLTWIVTYGVYDSLLSFTAAMTSAQYPSATKDAVVAPLSPKLVPMAPFWSVVRKPSPQPMIR